MKIQLNPFVVADPQRCIGCRVCELACFAAHGEREFRTVGNVETPVIPKLYLTRTADVTMPIQCRHCEDAPCANVCPIGAISQIDNTIIVDSDICAGCKTCMLACPFGALELVPYYKHNQPVIQTGLKIKDEDGFIDKQKMVANKCDLCSGLKSGPACVAACPQRALELIKPEAKKHQRNIDNAMRTIAAIRSL